MQTPTLLLASRDNELYQSLLRQKPPIALRLLRADDTATARILAPQAEIVLGEPERIAAILPKATRLRWAQSTFAGIDCLLAPDLRHDYLLTNIRGIFGPLMSEYVFAHLLSLTRHLPLYREQQRQQQWHPIPYVPLSQRRILILGTGSIGQHLATTAKQFGMEVWGVNRSGREVPGFDDLYQVSALPRLLPQVDIIVSVLPATSETHHLLDAQLLGLCKTSAILFNVGRGSAIDSQALVEALRAGRPAAAILDVFEEEPLPSNHPLWQLPNLIITPHNAAWSLPEQVLKLFERNLIRFQAEEPLEHVVDFSRGY